MNVQRILVGLDGSPLAESMLPLVLALARGFDLDVLLLRVIHLPDETLARWQEQAAVQARLLAQLHDEAEQYLRGLERWLAAVRVRARLLVVQGDAAAEIVHAAQQEQSDLIALATHGMSGLFTTAYGSVVEHVLHHAGRPLLLMRPRPEGLRAAVSIAQIVVPLDGSQLSESALPLAQVVARGLDVPLVVLRVAERVQSVVVPDGPSGVNVQERVLRDQWEDVEQYLRTISDMVRANGLRASAVAPSGAPATGILDYAREHPQCLIVMATRGRTGMDQLLVGSVARQVVQQSAAPILLLPPTLTPLT